MRLRKFEYSKLLGPDVSFAELRPEIILCLRLVLDVFKGCTEAIGYPHIVC